jgi:hypothetical protein
LSNKDSCVETDLFIHFFPILSNSMRINIRFISLHASVNNASSQSHKSFTVCYVLTHLTDVQLLPTLFEVLWLLEMLLCYHVDEEDEQGVAHALPSPLLQVAQFDAPISY